MTNADTNGRNLSSNTARGEEYALAEAEREI